MKIIVNAHDIKIIKEEDINKNEYNVSKCIFEFSEDYTDDLVKKVLFFDDTGQSYEKPIINNECDIAPEILKSKQNAVLGVYAYKIEDDKLILRYSPQPKPFTIEEGSYDENSVTSEEITPSQFEQYQQALNDGLNEVIAELKATKQIGDDVNKIGAETKKQGDYAKTQGDYAKEQGDYADIQGLKAENIANVVQNKLDNNEFIGPVGPQGEKGDKGEKGDCNFATFSIENGNLIMNKTEDLLLNFQLNSKGELEVLI
ncbi:MAG: hypothetical protein J6B89_03390 [Bacilli bacterium]|nr:hypothetical protein [Bacilli bacterium]